MQVTQSSKRRREMGLQFHHNIADHKFSNIKLSITVKNMLGLHMQLLRRAILFCCCSFLFSFCKSDWTKKGKDKTRRDHVRSDDAVGAFNNSLASGACSPRAMSLARVNYRRPTHDAVNTRHRPGHLQTPRPAI